MTTATNTNLVWRASTATEHLNWMKNLSDAFTAIGWAKTADTGQINLTGTTFALPSGINTYSVYYESGFEIRKLEAAGLPTIYCRIGYGISRGSYENTAQSNFPMLRFQFCTATDGAGGVQGTYTPGSATNPGYAVGSRVAPPAQRPFYFSSDGKNYLTLLIDPMLVGSPDRVSGTPLCLVFERTIGADTDAYDGDGFTIIDTMESAPGVPVANTDKTGFSTLQYKIVNLPLATVWGITSVPVQAPTHLTSSGVAGVTPMFPVTVMCPQIKGPMGSILYHFRSDILGAVTFKTRIYGVDRTFMSVGQYPATNSAIQSTSMSFAARYE